MQYFDQLRAYTGRNYTLTPLKPGSKTPIHKGWQARPTDLNEFTPDLNVGLVLGTASGGLVDVDLDHPAAITAATYLLPATAYIFGRASARGSHRLYRTEVAGKTIRYQGSDRGTIVELRGDGAQTMVPPSLHPDGERVEFEQNGEPATVLRADLERACRLIAAVVELAPHYKETSRHTIALAFAGVIVKLGHDHSTVRAAMTALCATTKDEETSDRLRAVDDTVARHRRGEPIQAWKALRERVGSPIVDHLSKLLGAAADDGDLHDGRPDGTHDLNDAGNADRVVALANGDLGYVPELGVFIHCKDGRWSRDESGLVVQRLAEQGVYAAIREAASASPSRNGFKDHMARLRFLERSLNLGAVRAAVGMAKSRVAVPLERLDADPDLLGVLNGVLDLRTCRLRENAREDYITRSAGAAFDAAARCPRFEQFMSQTFGGNAALIRHVEGVLGYCLTGHNNRQEIYLLIGDGANGKTTLLSVMLRLMGEYARPILSSTLFEGHRSDQADYDLALLPGVRLAVAQEAESKAQLHAARLKAMSGGDTIACRPIRKAPFFFRPCAKVIMVANRRPELDAYDEALKRRIRVIPFEHQVPEAKRDPGLVDKRSAELPGILNRLVHAGADYVAGKISTPEAVLKATTGYFFEKDNVAAYLAERTQASTGALLPKRELYDDYAKWCGLECLQPLAPRELNRVLSKKGLEAVRTNAARCWKNLRLREAIAETDEDIDRLMGAAANTA